MLAANIDVIWVVHGLDTAPTLRSLERYLAAAWDSGAVPEIVLTKADLASEPAQAVRDVEPVAPGVGIHVVSVEVPAGVHRLRGHLRPGRTVALLGPSGVGKSTLIVHSILGPSGPGPGWPASPVRPTLAQSHSGHLHDRGAGSPRRGAEGPVHAPA